MVFAEARRCEGLLEYCLDSSAAPLCGTHLYLLRRNTTGLTRPKQRRSCCLVKDPFDGLDFALCQVSELEALSAEASTARERVSELEAQLSRLQTPPLPPSEPPAPIPGREPGVVPAEMSSPFSARGPGPHVSIGLDEALSYAESSVERDDDGGAGGSAMDAARYSFLLVKSV